jgi:hypothetical protein
MRGARTRTVHFAIVCVLCASATAGYAWLKVSRARAAVADVALPPIAALASPEVEAPDAPARSVPAARDPVGPPAPRVLVRHTGIDRSFGFLSIAAPSAGTRRATPLSCDRAHFAGGNGACLLVERGFLTTYSAILFDAAFQPRHTLELNGIPSRTRMSPDGRLAAITVFVSGHSYSEGQFATETSIIDVAAGTPVVANLEELEVTRDGRPFAELDFNFWGVTFLADSRRFYATLGTGGRIYLVHGDIVTKQMRVVRQGIECPSLSPDNTRLAFKKQAEGTVAREWRLHVLNLETFEEIPLAETRNVDDQVEWLDDARVLYQLPQEPGSASLDIWVTAADGRGRPRIFLTNAASPAVVRTFRSGTD